MALVTQAAYARSRGCTRQAVSQAVKDGRIRLVRGRVDVEQADRDWPRVTEPLALNPDELSLAEIKRQRALLDLKAAHLTYLQRAGQLVEVAGIMPKIGSLAHDLRERLLGLGTRVVPQLQGLSLKEQVTLVEAAHRDTIDDFVRACDAAAEQAKQRATSGAS